MYFNPQPKTGQIRLHGKAKQELQARVRSRDSYMCQVCGRGVVYESPHHEPTIAQGGEDVESGMITLCYPCHRIRHDGPGSKEMKDKIVKRLGEINENLHNLPKS